MRFDHLRRLYRSRGKHPRVGYKNECGGAIVKTTRESGNIKNENCIIKENIKQQMHETNKKNTWKEKKVYGQYAKDVNTKQTQRSSDYK